LARGLCLEPGQRQVVEHHLHQLLQRHLDFVGMLPRLVARLPVPRLVAVAMALTEHVARLPRALPDTLRGLAILKAVLVEIAQRNADALGAVRGDDRLFGDQLAQILTDRLFHPLIVPQAVLESPAAQVPRQGPTPPAVRTVPSHTTSPAPAGG